MFAGHIGAALAIGRAERRVNVGTFIFAALLLDVIFWSFVLLGWESVSIPADFAERHQADFVFPYSHGLVASIAWSVIAAVVFAWAAQSGAGGWRAAALIAAAVFSHWLLDALTHQPELPLAGADSAKVGLGLWRNIPLALAVESTIVVAGLAMFLRGSTLSRGRSLALAALTMVILAFTIAGMTVAPPPPSAFAMAASSLITLIVVCALAWWIGRDTDKLRSRS